MPDYGIRIIGGYDWSMDQLAIVIMDQRLDRALVGKPLTFENHTPGLLAEPTLRLNKGDAQQLFDLLWKEGYRPADGTGNSGHTQALSNHLEDMRRLVFDGRAK